MGKFLETHEQKVPYSQLVFQEEGREYTPLLQRKKVRYDKIGIPVMVTVLMLTFMLIIGVTIGIYLLTIEGQEWPVSHPFTLIEREDWSESPEIPNSKVLSGSLIRNLMILHTRGKTCDNKPACVEIIVEMEKEFIEEHNKDLPYNFLIGGDGLTYEGRGWAIQHGFDELPKKNSALVIGIMGNFTEENPSELQLAEVKAFIIESIRRLKLSPFYRIFVVQDTYYSEIDAQALYEQLKVVENLDGILKI